MCRDYMEVLLADIVVFYHLPTGKSSENEGKVPSLHGRVSVASPCDDSRTVSQGIVNGSLLKRERLGRKA